MPPQQMRAAATERVSRIKASIAALRAENTEEMSVLQVALEKAQRQAAVRPVDHQIKATEDFIMRAKKRLLQHDVVINEAQEALQKTESMKRAEVERLAEAEELLQRLRVQVPEVPQIPRSVTDLEQLVAQLQSERDGLVDQLKNQRSTRLVEMVHPLQSSDEAAPLVLERSAKRGAVGEDTSTKPAGSRLLDGSKQLELRDALEMGDIGIIKELSQLLSKGALRMECCPSMVSNMVC